MKMDDFIEEWLEKHDQGLLYKNCKKIFKSIRKQSPVVNTLYNTMPDYVQKAFKDSPASTKYHGSFKHGLFCHTVLVMQCALRFMDSSPFNEQLVDETDLLQVAMFHDIGKIGKIDTHKKIISPYYSINENKSVTGNWDFINHQMMSLFNLQTLNIHLTYQAFRGVYMHNLAFAEKSGTDACPILLIVHNADMYVARLYNI